MEEIKNKNEKPLAESLLEKDFFHVLNNELWAQILVSVIVILFTLVPVYLFLSKRKSRRDVLFLGLCDAGKTVLFSRLLYDKFVQTHTSVKENLGEYIKPSGGSFRIVDIPGHERLRTKYLDQFKSTTRGIVFVIDSGTIQKDVRDVAEYLYTILTDNVMLSSCPNILILCNKQDSITAKGSKVITQILQKELNTLRITKSSQLESTDSSQNTTQVLGKDGKEFEFSALPYKVTFAECTATCKDEDKPYDIEPLYNWLQKL
ncbi:signal recognition particle receptor subunit beta [Chrysoperla carnea]|uniref:signal recognition particle receptor subunit beta n=1 Tax=Chrysoperla carnea TaxID=189513 RepID=UPI001D06D4C2|nr:signal recognition particle receptor subunit beta [Chrysoperla carnea]